MKATLSSSEINMILFQSSHCQFKKQMQKAELYKIHSIAASVGTVFSLAGDLAIKKEIVFLLKRRISSE